MMSSYQLGHRSRNHFCLSSYWLEPFCIIWSADKAPNGTWNEIFQCFVRCLINSTKYNQGNEPNDWFELYLWQTFKMQLQLEYSVSTWRICTKATQRWGIPCTVCKWGGICWGVFVPDRDDKVTLSQRREPDRVVECAVLAFPLRLHKWSEANKQMEVGISPAIYSCQPANWLLLCPL